MDETEPDMLADMTFPQKHRAKRHSTTPLSPGAPRSRTTAAPAQSTERAEMNLKEKVAELQPAITSILDGEGG